MWLMVAGGVPMVFVLVFGLIAVGAAVLFAVRPQPGRLGHVQALCRAVVFASLAGVAGDFATVSIQVQQHEEWHDQLALITLIGFGESLSPAILGFSLVAVAHLVSAVGARRLPPA